MFESEIEVDRIYTNKKKSIERVVNSIIKNKVTYAILREGNKLMSGTIRSCSLKSFCRWAKHKEGIYDSRW